MKKLLASALFCLMPALISAQGFSSFSVEGAVVETVIKNSGKTAGTIDVIVGSSTDITNLTPKYKLLSGCSLEGKLPTNYTQAVTCKVNKNDGSSNEWIIRIKKLVPASLPLKLDFSENNPSVFSNDVKGWAAIGTDETKPMVVRFGNKNVFFMTAFNAPAKELKFKLNVVGNNPFDGEFMVETSIDAKNWKKLDTYTDSKPIKNELYSYPLKEDVRFVRWTYLTRNKQNLNLNNIEIE